MHIRYERVPGHNITLAHQQPVTHQYPREHHHSPDQSPIPRSPTHWAGGRPSWYRRPGQCTWGRACDAGSEYRPGNGGEGWDKMCGEQEGVRMGGGWNGPQDTLLPLQEGVRGI